ncbi:MAG TPA: MaoC family dehydratase [Pseudonocardiaceae bacterium]|jgi:acyl dehydratase|nr:MaoC family dehydratase [Pseudonocardiaceae bacterium]
MRQFADLAEFVAAKGEHLGYSDWHQITQEQVNQFADATGDHQWIHVDVERAKAGPFGGTIAHGYLTLSLIPMLGAGIYRVGGLKMGINYGSNKVRFPNPVRVGSQVRAGAELIEITEVAMGTQAVLRYTVEIENEPKPACVAETVVLLAA